MIFVLQAAHSRSRHHTKQANEDFIHHIECLQINFNYVLRFHLKSLKSRRCFDFGESELHLVLYFVFHQRNF